MRRQIVEDAVSGPGHGGCRFPIAEQHSGAERLCRHVLTVEGGSQVGDEFDAWSLGVAAELVLASIAPVRRSVCARRLLLALPNENSSISLA